MQLSRHLYAICGLGLILTAVTLGSSKAAMRSSTQNVLVTNSSVPVTLSNTASVQVSNKVADGPLLVRDVDVYARTPVEGFQQSTMQENTDFDSVTLYTVPVGKRLVVQHLSLGAESPSGQQFYAAFAESLDVNDVSEMRCFFKIDTQGASGFGTTFFQGTVEAPIYVNAGHRLKVSAIRNASTGSAIFTASFAGYLEALPPGQ